MLNKRNLTRRAARSGRTGHGAVAVAGLMIGSVLLGGGMFLAGCSADSASSASSSDAAAKTAGQAAGQAAAAAPAAVPAASAASGTARSNPGAQGAGTTARLAPASSIIYTAQLTVRAGNVSSAVDQAAQIAEGAGGYVSSETASINPDHPSEATASVQLKIPVASYPATLGQLASRLGTQLCPAAAGPGRHPAGGRREQPGRLRRGGHRPAPHPAVARGLGRRPAQRAEPDQRRGIEPGVHAGSAARPQPRDQLRDGDPQPPRPEGQAGGAPARRPRPPWPEDSAPAGARCASPCPGRWPSSAR